MGQPSQATLNEKTDEHIVRIPTEDGFIKGTLPRIAGIVPLAAWFIVVNEFCERFAFYGGSAVFQNYVSGDEEPGSLEKSQSVATALSNYFTFFAYFTPLIGAVVADQYLGKYRTILVFSVIYMLGWIVLTITSIPTSTDGDFHTYGAAAFPGYIAAITIIGLGTGGIKSVVSPMCADQIPKEAYTVTKNGRQYIVDPDLTVQHLYNWFYWAINVGAMVGQVVCVKLERNAFWQAYLVPACMFVLSIAIFVAGTKRYKKEVPEGSIILVAWKCIRYGMARRNANPTAVSVPAGTNFKFLEWSEPIPGESPSEASKRTWDANFPKELRQTLKACSIFPLMSIYWVCYSQMLNNFISQAGQMKRPHWLDNDLVSMLDPIALVILIPLFDSFIYPFLTKHKIEFGYIKRIAVGFLLGALSMIYASVLQKKIYETGPNFDFVDRTEEELDLQPYNNISVFLQFPAYLLIALSEIFASIGSLEYSYTHAPTKMKCLISALALLPNAAASLIGLFLSPLAKDPTLTWMYAGAGIAAFIATIAFWFLYRKFDDEDLALKRAAVAAETSSPSGDTPAPAYVGKAEAEADERVHVR
ncbi:hypothetical protein PhCBS80983_g06242 [Powellomyces hirtus]|uniref:Major facilitator superfamily (MFS) profile domain-containing protein n=1 Tax=Powellomyces hirtus TaxID=109895 RepID=A0A507DPS7_9FUNG|nr:hypothetical protein PhCBS80983_g06242 [Powellomyces hirtus]